MPPGVRKFLAVVAFFLVCGQAWAHGIPKAGIELTSTEAWPVGTYTSESGEAKEAFLLRIAPEVAAWTAENQAEACAFVTTDG